MNWDRLPPGIDADDLRQEGELAALQAEARGEDPEEAREQAIRRAFRAAYTKNRWESAAAGHFSDREISSVNSATSRLGWLPEASKVVGLSPPAKQTEGQRKRFRRNQVIYAASLAGFSQRLLAKVFDMPRSQIQGIVEDMRQKTGHARSRPPA